MTGSIELSDQDVQDLYNLINHYLDPPQTQRKIKPAYADRLKGLKERLLEVEVNSHV